MEDFARRLIELKLSSLNEAPVGDRSGAGPSMEPKFEYFSARLEEMLLSDSHYPSVVEQEIEHSKSHWTESSGVSDTSEDNNVYEQLNRENAEELIELMNDPEWTHKIFGPFFIKCFPWKPGKKIAEGGQAEICEALDNDGNVQPGVLLKVFKRGFYLSDLRKQWPRPVLRKEVVSIVQKGTILDDGRFAFAMTRCWGDLRTLINQAKRRNNEGRPFPYEWYGNTLYAEHIMWKIAHEMMRLHMQGVLHRDLKAANILLYACREIITLHVADFECSIGVNGTGFWRAPELLEALKSRKEVDFSEKMDVYSFGMTCFEIVTGRLPFQEELDNSPASIDLVINEGRRPTLPRHLDEVLKLLIQRCWDPIPEERPSFLELCNTLSLYTKST